MSKPSTLRVQQVTILLSVTNALVKLMHKSYFLILIADLYNDRRAQHNDTYNLDLKVYHLTVELLKEFEFVTEVCLSYSTKPYPVENCHRLAS